MSSEWHGEDIQTIAEQAITNAITTGGRQIPADVERRAVSLLSCWLVCASKHRIALSVWNIVGSLPGTALEACVLGGSREEGK